MLFITKNMSKRVVLVSLREIEQVLKILQLIKSVRNTKKSKEIKRNCEREEKEIENSYTVKIKNILCRMTTGESFKRFPLKQD